MNNVVLTAAPMEAVTGKKISSQLGVDFTPFHITTFPSGEFCIDAGEILTGKTVILLHHIPFPVNHLIVQLMLAMNAIRQRKPDRLILLMPYFPYSRQDRWRNEGRAIGAEAMAQLIQIASPDSLLVMDLHSSKIIDYFDIPVTHLTANSLFAKDIATRFSLNDVCLVSPDAGGKERVQEIAQMLNVPHMHFVKKRLSADDMVVEPTSPMIEKKIYIFIDDIIDTGKTLLNAAEACPLLSQMHIYATHGLLSQHTSSVKLKDRFKSITVTDTLQQPNIAPQVSVISCWQPFIEAIKGICT